MEQELNSPEVVKTTPELEKQSDFSEAVKSTPDTVKRHQAYLLTKQKEPVKPEMPKKEERQWVDEYEARIAYVKKQKEREEKLFSQEKVKESKPNWTVAGGYWDMARESGRPWEDQ